MKKKTITILLIFLAAALVIGGVVLANQWNRPLGVGFSLATRTASPEGATLPTSTADPNQVTKQVTSTSSATPAKTLAPTTGFTPSSTPKPVCGNVPLMYILAVGADSTDPKYLYGMADVIRIIRVDFITPKVTVLTLPRDLFVQFPDIIPSKANEVKQGRLNQAYFFGNPGMQYFAGEGEGPGLLASTIASNFDLYVDHYAAVNMTVFEDIVDAMGGVDIYLYEAIDGRVKGDDTSIGRGYFPVGWNHLTGYDAINLVRIRSRYSEPIRTDHQTLVICAITNKLRQPATLTAIPRMVTSVIKDVQTDLTLSQITQLACVLPKLSSENLQFFRIPEEMLTQANEEIAHVGTGFVWKYDPAELKAFIDKFENDELVPTAATGTGGCPEQPARPKN